jgi:DNA-binding response OmpR family regulator
MTSGTNILADDGVSVKSRVLIVEDSPEDLKLVSDILNLRNFEVFIAMNGSEALARLETVTPDIILLDVLMPGIDGYQLCEKLKENRRLAHVPIIFISSLNQPVDKVKGLLLGGADYIGKPFNDAEVLARIHVQLRNAQQLRGFLPEIPLPKGLTRRESTLLRQSIDLLCQDVANPPTVVRLSRMVGVNIKFLNAVFHKAFGMPVSSWLRDERLSRAYNLLNTSNDSIGQIALQVGYTSQTNFSRAFRHKFKTTPRAVRGQLGHVDATDEIEDAVDELPEETINEMMEMEERIDASTSDGSSVVPGEDSGSRGGV